MSRSLSTFPGQLPLSGRVITRMNRAWTKGNQTFHLGSAVGFKIKPGSLAVHEAVRKCVVSELRRRNVPLKVLKLAGVTKALKGGGDRRGRQMFLRMMHQVSWQEIRPLFSCSQLVVRAGLKLWLSVLNYR